MEILRFVRKNKGEIFSLIVGAVIGSTNAEHQMPSTIAMAGAGLLLYSMVKDFGIDFFFPLLRKMDNTVSHSQAAKERAMDTFERKKGHVFLRMCRNFGLSFLLIYGSTLSR